MDLKTRAVNILTSPRTEWPIIAAERTDPATLYREYVMILAAIPPICGFIGGTLIGIHGYHVSFGSALTFAVLHYLMTLVGVYLLAMIISKLAPSFSGTENMGQALKLAAYFGTAAWLGGVALLVPFLRIIGYLASLYSLYLLYVGLPVLMRAPSDTTFGYTLAVIFAAVVVWVGIVLVVGFFVTTPMLM